MNDARREPAADVPSPIDLRSPDDARAWEATANAKRPWRADFFALMANEVARVAGRTRRVLELGSGPGFLAEQVLRTAPDVAYVALDFSAPMHALARARLGDLARRVDFVERDFRAPDWTAGLGQFDAVLTNQAVHELRHKRHALRLHQAVLPLLAPGGAYLVSDHFAGAGGMDDDRLYMTIDEQREILRAAGFSEVRWLWAHGGLTLHRASVPGAESEVADGLEAITRFVALSPSLAIAGQPTEAQVGAVARAGFEVMINLALHDDPRYSLPDEAATARTAGLDYVHIPVHYLTPTRADLERFCAAMDAAGSKKVFVHCAHNKRVPVFVALWRIRNGWPREEALAAMHAVWQPDAIWQKFLAASLAP